MKRVPSSATFAVRGNHVGKGTMRAVMACIESALLLDRYAVAVNRNPHVSSNYLTRSARRE